MSALPCLAETQSPSEDAPTTPFAQALVTISKQAYIQLIHDAHSWKSLHGRAITRTERLVVEHARALEQAAQREATLRIERDAAWPRSAIYSSGCLVERASERRRSKRN